MIKLRTTYKTKYTLSEPLLKKLNERRLLTPELEEAYYIQEELEELIVPAINTYLKTGYVAEEKREELQRAVSTIQEATINVIKEELETIYNRYTI